MYCGLQGAPSESPYGNPDMWSSDGWRGTLDTARSDYSSIPSDTSSPRQYAPSPVRLWLMQSLWRLFLKTLKKMPVPQLHLAVVEFVFG